MIEPDTNINMKYETIAPKNKDKNSNNSKKKKKPKKKNSARQFIEQI